MNWNILVTIEKIKRDSVSNDEWTWNIDYKKYLKYIYKYLKNVKTFTLKGASPVGNVIFIFYFY